MLLIAWLQCKCQKLYLTKFNVAVICSIANYTWNWITRLPKHYSFIVLVSINIHTGAYEESGHHKYLSELSFFFVKVQESYWYLF